jgi:hypothetical protein
MMRLKNVLAGLLLMVATSTQADNYAYLNVNTNAGENSYTVTNINKITFDTDNMVLHLTDGTTTALPLTGLDKMWFSNQGTGISTLNAADNVQMNVQGGMLTVTSDTPVHVTLYNIGGTMMSEAQTENGEAQLNLRGMTKGVYIVRINGKAQKVMNK